MTSANELPSGHKTTGRKKHQDKPTRFELSIPESVFNTMELYLADPLTGKPVYGARSKLIQMLLREHFKGLEAGGIGTLDAQLAKNLAQEGLKPSPHMLLNTIRDCLIKGGFQTSAPLLVAGLKEVFK